MLPHALQSGRAGATLSKQGMSPGPMMLHLAPPRCSGGDMPRTFLANAPPHRFDTLFPAANLWV